MSNQKHSQEILSYEKFQREVFAMAVYSILCLEQSLWLMSDLRIFLTW